MVMLEALLIGFFASLLGAVLGAGIAWYISTVGIDYTSTMKAVNMDFPLSYIYYGLFRWSFILTGFGLGMLFALLAAIPAALRAARMEPTEALRE
jgi:putative ABC transport system permease protein